MAVRDAPLANFASVLHGNMLVLELPLVTLPAYGLPRTRLCGRMLAPTNQEPASNTLHYHGSPPFRITTVTRR